MNSKAIVCLVLGCLVLLLAAYIERQLSKKNIEDTFIAQSIGAIMMIVFMAMDWLEKKVNNAFRRKQSQKIMENEAKEISDMIKNISTEYDYEEASNAIDLFELKFNGVRGCGDLSTELTLSLNEKVSA